MESAGNKCKRDRESEVKSIGENECSKQNIIQTIYLIKTHHLKGIEVINIDQNKSQVC